MAAQQTNTNHIILLITGREQIEVRNECRQEQRAAGHQGQYSYGSSSNVM